MDKERISRNYKDMNDTKDINSSTTTEKISMYRSVCRQLPSVVWIAMTLLLVGSVCSVTDASAIGMHQMCGVDSNWICKREIKEIPMEVLEVCQTCGSIWANVPGLELCCRCSQLVFGFCLDGVYGYGRR